MTVKSSRVLNQPDETSTIHQLENHQAEGHKLVSGGVRIACVSMGMCIHTFVCMCIVVDCSVEETYTPN